MYDKEYAKNYYYERKELIKKRARQYYHLHKNDPSYSHYLPYRLKLQRDYYAEKKNNVKKYDCKGLYNTKNLPNMKINKGIYIIEMN